MNEVKEVVEIEKIVAKVDSTNEENKEIPDKLIETQSADSSLQAPTLSETVSKSETDP